MSLNNAPQEASHKKRKITIEMKCKIIKKQEQCGSLTDACYQSASRICTILKDLTKINASKGVTRISTQRLCILDDVKMLLLVWIHEKQLQGDRHEIAKK
ncbi:hypothetical protein AVEN_52409-1 [Araneus ventricosus]|uniref:HTH psq-type domain-containing protein n=1 Tax=Araneus ventricosus TaxID=182803 RepID=A0A4Y2GYC6_ARAVE|nr:hypothetical protein AVEN_52409-1 [Araneus ventricosus]